MRGAPDVSPDVDARWKPALKGISFFYKDEPHVPSVRNAIQNALARLPLNHRWWINDPDCLLLRPDTLLTLAEVQTMASIIALSGGPLLISDYLPSLPADRLAIVAALLPLIGQPARVLDWFDAQTPSRLRLDLGGACGSWHLLALFNWVDVPQEMTLHLSEYGLAAGGVCWGREFWGGRVFTARNGSIPLGEIPSHGAALLAVRPGQPETPLYLGGDLHLSQGLEVTAWEVFSDELRFSIQRPGRIAGSVDLSLPGPVRNVTLNGSSLVWELVADGVYRLPLQAFETAAIQVSWSE
jgi:alpha-galactosidase